MDLMADIGATHTRCALVQDKGEELAAEIFNNADFQSLTSLLKRYLERRRATDRPKRAALAVAAPIVGDEVRMLNIDWHFSQAELRAELKLAELTVCNDFAAIAWGLPHFVAADLHTIGRGRKAAGAALATLGPGSGLGVGALVPTTDGWAAMTGEGGHSTLPATTREEADVIAQIRDRYGGHCSAERVLSGPGLVNLYVALAELARRGPSAELTPADVTARAKEGEPLARKAQLMFFAFLGIVAGDLALTTGARGGVYIAGGIVPRLLDELAKSEFRARFEAKGRYASYLGAIPTYVITDPLPAFRGLRHLLGYR
ncbi:MAG TPA: glucokinase [Gammaproteobacteria bacterium]|nr:glucokinase [Gammaproteobacteria bacterium]